MVSANAFGNDFTKFERFLNGVLMLGTPNVTQRDVFRD
jgi:hypothetical protein